MTNIRNRSLDTQLKKDKEDEKTYDQRIVKRMRMRESLKKAIVDLPEKKIQIQLYNNEPPSPFAKPGNLFSIKEETVVPKSENQIYSEYRQKLLNQHLANKPKPPSNRFSWGLVIVGIMSMVVGFALTAVMGLGIPLIITGVIGISCLLSGLSLRHLDEDEYQIKMYAYQKTIKAANKPLDFKPSSAVKGNTPQQLLSMPSVSAQPVKKMKSNKNLQKKNNLNLLFSATGDVFTRGPYIKKSVPPPRYGR